MERKTKRYIELGIVNILTLIRFIGAFIIPFIYHYKGASTTAIWVLFIFLTDAFDGALARKWHTETFFGGLFDSVADKLFSIVSLIILCIERTIMFIPLVMEAIILSVNSYAYSQNKNLHSSKIGKIKTILLDITVVIGIVFMASPIYIDYFNNTFRNLFINYNNLVIIILGIIIIIMQAIVLADYGKIAFTKSPKFKKENKELISFKELVNLAFDTEFYLANKDKPLREILYKSKN